MVRESVETPVTEPVVVPVTLPPVAAVNSAMLNMSNLLPECSCRLFPIIKVMLCVPYDLVILMSFACQQ